MLGRGVAVDERQLRTIINIDDAELAAARIEHFAVQVKGDVLVESGSTNITNAIAGKLSGVMTIQTSGQPGENDAEILIRGVSSFNGNSPLVLVDGVERDFASPDPNEVANISVLKDASATAVFGAKGANGVIIVTTKNGNEGKPKMDLSFSAGLSNPINTAKHIDSYTTMSLMNVAGAGRFACDRAINEYARDIWHTKPLNKK